VTKRGRHATKKNGRLAGGRRPRIVKCQRIKSFVLLCLCMSPQPRRRLLFAQPRFESGQCRGMTRCTHLGFHPNKTHQTGMFACTHIRKDRSESYEIAPTSGAPETRTKARFAQTDGRLGVGCLHQKQQSVCLPQQRFRGFAATIRTLRLASQPAPAVGRRRPYGVCRVMPTVTDPQHARGTVAARHASVTVGAWLCGWRPGSRGWGSHKGVDISSRTFSGVAQTLSKTFAHPSGATFFSTYGGPDSLASFLE